MSARRYIKYAILVDDKAFYYEDMVWDQDSDADHCVEPDHNTITNFIATELDGSTEYIIAYNLKMTAASLKIDKGSLARINLRNTVSIMSWSKFVEKWSSGYFVDEIENGYVKRPCYKGEFDEEKE